MRGRVGDEEGDDLPGMFATPAKQMDFSPRDTIRCDACQSRPWSVVTLILLRLAATVIKRASALRSLLDGATYGRDLVLSRDPATRVLVWVTITIEVLVLLALVGMFRMVAGA
jgi:hypothetical protein